MFNDVNKRGNGKEAAAGESLSAHSSRLLLYVSTYESEIRESGGNVGLIMSVQSFSFVCVWLSGASARVPLRARGLSVCVHVVIGCIWGSTEGGRRLRFGGRFLVSALVEQHIGRFCLRERKRIQLHNRNAHLMPTPDAESKEG